VDETKIVLHAIPHEDRVHCYIPEEMGYRDPATQTVTTVDSGEDVDVFLYLLDYELAAGAAFQLVWPADWIYYGWSGDCMGHQITITDFTGSSIHIGTVFDPVTGGNMAPLGYAGFTTGAGGEVHLDGTWMCPNTGGGLCYINEFEELPLAIGNAGRVAVGDDGYNPAAPLAVATSTWGTIKSQYRHR
jgi:hypothetical protein